MIPSLSLFAILFLILYFVSGTVSLYLTIRGWRRRNLLISRPFTLLMGCLTVFCYAYICEVFSPDLETSLVFNNIEVPVMLTIPVAFLLLVLYFTGRDKYVTPWTVSLLFSGVAILSILEFTNPFHYLYYTGFAPFPYEGMVFWIHRHGPFFWLSIVYIYTLVFIALGLIISHMSATGPCHRRSLRVLLLAAVVPVIINLVCTFWFTPVTGMDITQLSFLVSGLIIAFGLFPYLFSSVPVAYAQVLSTMQDGVIIIDGSARVIDLNPAATRMTGIRLRDAVGKEIGNLVPALNGCPAGACMTETGARTECRLGTDGAAPLYLDVIAVPLGDRDSASEGTLLVLRDITERKQSELALAEANRKIALLSGITRHDIRNQLTALRTYIHLGTESPGNSGEMNEYLQKLDSIAGTISRQIDFTRDYETMGASPPVWQEIGAAVRAGSEGLFLDRVQIDADAAGIDVFADPLLVRVFYNLFDNSLRYGGKGMDTIRVWSRPDGQDLLIVYEDNGEGVSADDKPQLFSKGFGRNTGLGLFLSREILSLTGMTITENGEPGKGARFEIRVPAGKYRYPATGR